MNANVNININVSINMNISTSNIGININININRYVDQGGGKRPGAFAVYIEPWHADVFEVLDLKKNHGKDELRAR